VSLFFNLDVIFLFSILFVFLSFVNNCLHHTHMSGSMFPLLSKNVLQLQKRNSPLKFIVARDLSAAKMAEHLVGIVVFACFYVICLYLLVVVAF